MEKLKPMLEFEEGRKNKPYKCSAGHWTYGIGHKMTSDEIKNYAAITTISDAIIDKSFESDKQKAINAAKKYLWFDKLNEPRQAVVISMIFQMGHVGFAKFENTIKVIAKGQYQEASENMLKSLWAKQTPSRARRHAEQMKTGEWCKEYK